MNKDEEINQLLDDIISAQKKQNDIIILFGIGLLVISICGMAGTLLYLIRMVL